MVKNLSELASGDKGVIGSINAEGGLKKRLLAMGIFPGGVVEVLRAAPFGDPVEVCVLGYTLSLRKEEARCVTLKE